MFVCCCIDNLFDFGVGVAAYIGLFVGFVDVFID